MATNINFTNDLNDESDANISYNLPRKIYRNSLKRAVAAGATAEAESCTYNIMLDMDYERLLNRASLLVTPTLYKEGVLYPQIPTYNSNGDFTVTRATTATRVNAAGLVELVPYNLLQYSEMFSQAIWTKLNATISANTTTAPNGTLTADSLMETSTTSFDHYMFVSTLPNLSNSHTYSIYLKQNGRRYAQLATVTTQGVFRPIFDLQDGVYVSNAGNNTGATTLIESVGDGWYRCSVILPSNTTNFTQVTVILQNSATYQSYLGDPTKGVYVWGAQLVEGTSALDYQMTETRLNIPRLDYSLGSCPNILLEPQRTNLALRSEEFDNATWTKVASSVTANSTTSPSGIVNADTFIGNGTSNSHFLVQNLSVTLGAVYTHSVYAKKNTNNFIQLAFNNGFAATSFANFDLNNGVLGTVGATASATITNVGNDWYRCTLTATAISTTTTNIPAILLVTSASAVFFQANSLSTSVFLWGAQFELGAYPTSYIPTTSASVTRNTDTFTLSNVFTNNLISSAGGTWFVDLRDNIPRTRESSASGVPYLGDSNSAGVGNNFRILGFTASRYLIQKFVAGVATTIYITTSNTSKIAIKWNGTTADVFENGVKVVTATSFTATALDFLAFRTDQVLFNINSMALYNTPISDTECIAITTL
jgi:hypothetical protein